MVTAQNLRWSDGACCGEQSWDVSHWRSGGGAGRRLDLQAHASILSTDYVPGSVVGRTSTS